MSRLTNFQGILHQCINCVEEDNCYEFSCGKIEEAIKKLAEYEEKQEQGLLIELPCKVGDVVYFPIYDYHDSAIIETIRVEENGIFFDWYQLEVGCDCTEVWDDGTFTLEMVGKSVFLTRSEAEEALARMKGE